MAALGTFVPGLYTGTYNANAIGIIKSDGFSLRFRHSIRKINDTAQYGDTLIDGVYRGLAGVQLLVTFKEWNTAVKQTIWPWSNLTTPVFDGAFGQIGMLASAAAKAIVLTPEALSPAAVEAGAGADVFTASMALLAPENDVSILMGPDERDVPVLFDLYLYDDSGTKRFFKFA